MGGKMPGGLEGDRPPARPECYREADEEATSRG